MKSINTKKQATYRHESVESGPIARRGYVEGKGNSMRSGAAIRNQRGRRLRSSSLSQVVTLRGFDVVGRAWALGRQAWWVRAGLIAAILVIPSIGLGGGCRSVQRAESPVHQQQQSGPDDLATSHTDALLDTEAAQMAVEDQQRAGQAYEQLQEKKYPRRDYPIRPVIRP